MDDLGRTWWLWGVVLGMGCPDAHEMRYRVALDPLEVTVRGPALEQSGQFCRYTLMNRRLQPIQPKVAWTPCYSIDKVFSTP